ncbi:helix-turn-helix domain-containing protein [Kaustia mangrovi]|uniref:Helix-turn-helix domain-containing protein n=1 Tax=Kaustia mangrovi TaxID=2593653 RepID=A0A7S8HC19_9HYPH|nr:IclR family transcriptional regulator C-terminal domain-containing protein [Kaustia mangrovi]QPC43004.1 helix-turn-helix domain-containing protein [Kaustia mangrovi]
MVYKPVTAALRVLEVLEALNAIGPAGLTAIHKRTGISKATTLRMLETLCSAGFASYDAQRREYAVGLRSLALSSGYDADDEIVMLAQPTVARLRAELGWPSDIVVCRDDRLVIADTNARDATFAVVRHRGPGSQIPFTISATGRAWLAFCDEEARQRLLRFERPHSEESESLMKDPERLATIVETTRRRGYGLQSGEFFSSEAGAGVPVFVHGVLRCCLNIVVARNAVSMEQLEERYVPRLLEAAREIAQKAGG